VKIEILDEAEADLIEGYHFYEAQADGLGSYFLDSLFSDIDSLLIHAGLHAVVCARFSCAGGIQHFRTGTSCSDT